MADEENKEVKEEKEEKEEKEDSKEQKTSKAGILRWVIMAAVVLICAGSGFFLGRLFAGSPTAETAQENKPAPAPAPAENSTSESGTTWFYDLAPVVSNLDEPGVTRYVRAVVTLEMSPLLMEKDGIILLEKKTPIITNWLTIYLASLSIEDIRGDKNLKRIQSQILDAFNETFFPDEKPKIKHVLFKEFAIQ